MPSKRTRKPLAESENVNEVKKEVVEMKKQIRQVDEQCPIAGKCRIYCDEHDTWDCMLNQTNIQNNNNKYFLIQLLQDLQSGNYYTWFRWGRVGYNGQNNLQGFNNNLDKAKVTFAKKFADKTRNAWNEKGDFEKVPGKYDLVKVTLQVEEDEVDAAIVEAKRVKMEVQDSQLKPQVQQLIQLVCDVKTMEETILGLDFDTNKSPLGKVTEEQIRSGYKALADIANMLNANASSSSNSRKRGKSYSRSDLMEACNAFYTRIPHNFGMRVPPMIQSLAEVKAKIELLEALGDIQIGIKIILDNEQEEVLENGLVMNPIDVHYKRLDVQLDPLEHDSDEFSLLEKYIQSTHASTHSQYLMDVEEIFECRKEALPFQDKGNKMLLFHGSRMSNYAGILGQGLRIAPPEAPVTGYMFGKGCYFADMSSKSANYCFATRSNPVGLLLMCEVSLGQPNQLLQADYKANKLPKGKHSVKGLGRVAADEKGFARLPDGTVVPLGPANNNVDMTGATLNYNEYIVYDVQQVKMRYIAKIKFQFK